MEQKRSSFSGRIGFVLAAAGSAVGLGNIWRFPYLAAKYGGGIFLLVYIILVLTLGFALMTAEISIGRKTGTSAVDAYKVLDKRFSFIGYLTALVPMIILPYYSVIGGWVTKYLVTYITGGGSEAAADGYFTGFTSQLAEPLLWLALFVGITSVIVFCGVEKGIEKASKVMMPVLVVLSVLVAIYSSTRPGALEGLKFYLVPDFSRFSAMTVLAAMGQMFYSMSLAMGIMVTFGSYMKKEDDIDASVKQIELFDTSIAVIAGLMVVPAVFAFSGGDETAIKAGSGLMFETLPKVFASAGLIGQVAGGLFFLLVLLAALTSSVSLMETAVSIINDKFHLGRKKTCLLVLIGCFLVAIPSSLGKGVWSHILLLGEDFLDFFDFIANSVLMPIVALCTCIFVGYFLGGKALTEEVAVSSAFKRRKMFEIIIKYIAPICIILILVSSVLNYMNILTI